MARAGGPHGLSHTPHYGVCVVRQEVRISVPSKSIIVMSNTSVHKRDCLMRKISKKLTKIFRTRPKQGTRVVFKFSGGSDDFIMQKVYLLWLMPVYVGVIM